MRRQPALGTNRASQPGEHVDMDFIKLFGAVIAFCFHPGSASKVNGKSLTAEETQQLRELLRLSDEAIQSYVFLLKVGLLRVFVCVEIFFFFFFNKI